MYPKNGREFTDAEKAAHYVKHSKDALKKKNPKAYNILESYLKGSRDKHGYKVHSLREEKIKPETTNGTKPVRRVFMNQDLPNGPEGQRLVCRRPYQGRNNSS